MPADYDEMLTFVRMIARMQPVTVDTSDDQLESNTAALNSLIQSARLMTEGTVVSLNARELATVLAALRYWQGLDLTVKGVHEAEFDIATDGGKLSPLDPYEIDALCESLNTE